jgi:hypothetical protein
LIIGELTNAGPIALMPMPFLPYSTAAVCERPTTPC